MIDIKYAQFFSVELLHKYSVDQACTDFTIVPSLPTKQILDDNRIIMKQYNNKLYAGANLDPDQLKLNLPVQKPFIVPAEGLQLTFFLLLNNPTFYNYTSLKTSNKNGNIYYFTNRNNNACNNKNLLTQSLPDYVPGNYNYEDVVVDAGIVYQSVSANNSSNVNSTEWRKVDNNRYMSGADLLSWIPSVSTFQVSPVSTTINVVVTGYDGTGNYTAPVFSTTMNNPGNLPSFTIDLSTLKSGKYLLSINGAAPISVYLYNELNNTQVFGIIDLYIESTLPNSYKILDVNNVLQSPVYSIYFLNRATIWKYTLRRTGTALIKEANDFYKFTTLPPTVPPTPTTVLSQFPIPLSQNPLTILLDDQTTHQPCANANRLSRNGTDPVYYSEIFLNQ
jgi:hypothetical protein